MTSVGLSPVVNVGGQILPDQWQAALLEIRVELQFQVPARVTLRFTDSGYALLSAKTVSIGTTVDVLDPNLSNKKLVSAEVTAISCEQRPGEQPELVLTALDKSHRLGRATTIKVFQNSKYSDIVSQIASGAGLSASTDTTDVTFDYLMQAESDLALITEAAQRTGFDWWVDGDTLNFKKPAANDEVTLGLGTELRSFSARASGFQPSKVTVDGWDRDKQQLVTFNVTSAAAPVATSDFANLTSKATSAFGSAEVVTGGLGAESSGEAQTLAQTILDRAVTATVSAKGVADGNGNIALGKKVKVTGAGPLNGDYPITAVEHIYRSSSGFVTRFTSGERRPTTLIDTLAGPGAVNGGAYAGPAHIRTGVTVGKVTNNKDPNNMGRVKVRYPGVSSDAESGWARVVSVGGGTSRGSVWIPEVDDEVLVAFEGGDARRPVVIGGLFGNTSTMPTTDIQDGKVQSRAMTSRLGHVISFLDGTATDKQAIELVLAGNQHSVHLGKDKLTATVPSGLPVEITAGNTSVKFSASGDVTVQGTNVTIKADSALKLQGTQVSIQADAALDMKAQAKAGLSGAIVEVQSQGPAKVAGQPVMIN